MSCGTKMFLINSIAVNALVHIPIAQAAHSFILYIWDTMLNAIDSSAQISNL